MVSPRQEKIMVSWPRLVVSNISAVHWLFREMCQSSPCVCVRCFHRDTNKCMLNGRCHFRDTRCHNPLLTSLSIKMLGSECFFLFLVKGLHQLMFMHGRIPGDSPQTTADLSHRVKLEDNLFNGDGAHSDVYTKLTSSSKNYLGNSWKVRMWKRRDCL